MGGNFLILRDENMNPDLQKLFGKIENKGSSCFIP